MGLLELPLEIFRAIFEEVVRALDYRGLIELQRVNSKINLKYREKDTNMNRVSFPGGYRRRMLHGPCSGN